MCWSGRGEESAVQGRHLRQELRTQRAHRLGVETPVVLHLLLTRQAVRVQPHRDPRLADSHIEAAESVIVRIPDVRSHARSPYAYASSIVKVHGVRSAAAFIATARRAGGEGDGDACAPSPPIRAGPATAPSWEAWSATGPAGGLGLSSSTRRIPVDRC